MGLAFKPNIDDLRESPAKFVVEQMLVFNQAEYFVVEPNVGTFSNIELKYFEDAHSQADIVVFLVAHKEFFNLPKKQAELDFCGIRK